MMSQMAARWACRFGRRSSKKQTKGKNKQAGKKKGGRGPTPPKNQSVARRRHARRFPGPVRNARRPQRIAAGLADFDLSKLKFPGKN